MSKGSRIRFKFGRTAYSCEEGYLTKRRIWEVVQGTCYSHWDGHAAQGISQLSSKTPSDQPVTDFFYIWGKENTSCLMRKKRQRMMMTRNPWTIMHDRQERTCRFWRYVNAYGFEDKDLSQHSDGARECQDVDPNLLAFVTFAQEVGIKVPNDHGDKTIFESFTIIQEQMRWETQFVDLAWRLDVDVRYKNSDELEERTCAIKHRDIGFEDQEVYVWYWQLQGQVREG